VQLGGVWLTTPPALQVPALDAHVAMISGDVAQVQGLGQVIGILCVQTQPDETGGPPLEPGDLLRGPRVQMRSVGLARGQTVGSIDARLRGVGTIIPRLVRHAWYVRPLRSWRFDFVYTRHLRH
jgi:hypothetical protein